MRLFAIKASIGNSDAVNSCPHAAICPFSGPIVTGTFNRRLYRLQKFTERYFGYLVLLAIICTAYHESHKKAHILRTLYAAERLESSILGLESAQRGYLVTGDPDFLRDFAISLSQEKYWTVSLGGSLQDDQPSLAKLRVLANTTAEKVAEMQATLDLYTQGRQDEAKRLVETREGQHYMRDIRDLLQNIRVSKEVESIDSL